MADENSVGSVFLDLILRDHTEKQLQQSADRARQSAQQAFSGVEQASQKMADTVTTQTAKTVQNVTQTTAKTVRQAFDKSVALAEAKVYQLGEKLEATTAKLWDAQHNDSTFKVHGYVSEGNTAYSKLLKEQEQLTEKLRFEEERLAIIRESVAQRSAAAAEKAALKQAQEAEKAAQKAASAAEKAALKREAAAQKAAEVEARAAQKAAEAEEKAASRRKAANAAMWKNMLSKAGAGAKSILGKLTGIGKGYDRAGKAGQRFKSRLREIASGALIFNGISAAIRGVVNYFGQSIKASDQMQSALANLKGAAANAASPIIQVLTPALTALANAAATVFSYVAKLMTMLTGKISTAAATATKGAGAAKKAMASLAGFDEIQKLDGKNDGSGGSETQTPNYDFEGKSPFLDELLDGIKAGQWGQVGELLAKKLNDSLAAIDWEKIQRKCTAWTENLVDTINGFTRNLDWGLIGSTIGNGLNTILGMLNTFLVGTDWKAMGKGFAEGISGLFGTVDWALIAANLLAGLSGLMDLCSGFVQNIDWRKLGSDLWNGLIGVVRGIDWARLVASAFELLGSVIGGAAALFEGLCTSVFESLEAAWDNTVSYFDTFIEDAGGNIILGLWNGIIAALANVGQWIKDNIFQPFIDGFKDAFGIHSPSTVMEEQGGFIIDGLLGGITNAWEKVKTFFATALSDVETKLSDAFESIKTTVSDIWENGIVPAIKGPINAIISCINAMISGVVTGINTMVRALNRIHFDIPDWVPGMGGKSFGFHLSELSAPQIPMLAKGGVIKQPTLAMMGEYSGARNNPEIVAPQAIIEETVANVMGNLAQINAMGFEQIIALLREILEAILGIEIDGETISRAVENYKRKMAAAKGGA